MELLKVRTVPQIPFLSADPCGFYMSSVADPKVGVYPAIAFEWPTSDAFIIQALADEVVGRGSAPVVCLQTQDHFWQISLVLELSPGNETWMRRLIPDNHMRSHFERHVEKIVFTTALMLPDEVVKPFRALVDELGFFLLMLHDEGQTCGSQYIIPEFSESLPKPLVQELYSRA